MTNRHRNTLFVRTALLWKSLAFVVVFGVLASLGAVAFIESGWIEAAPLVHGFDTQGAARYAYTLSATNDMNLSYTSEGRVAMMSRRDGGWTLRQYAFTREGLTESGQSVFVATQEPDGSVSFREGMGGTILTVAMMLPEHPVVVGDSWTHRVVSETRAPARNPRTGAMEAVDISVQCEGTGRLEHITERDGRRLAGIAYRIRVAYGSTPARDVQARALFDIGAGRFERINIEMPGTREAASSFTLAIVRDDASADLDEARNAFVRAEGLYRRGRFMTALSHYDDACRLAPADIDYRLAYARALLQARRIREADTVAALLIDSDINGEEALWVYDLRARTAVALGRRETALEAIERLRGHEGGEALALLRDADWLEATGADPRDAGERYLDALRLDGSLVEARLGMARAYGRMNRGGERLAVLEEALENAPGDPRILLAIGQCHLDRNHAAKALDPLREALTIEPANDALRRALADTYRAMDRDLEAAEQLNAMLYRIGIDRPYAETMDLRRELADTYMRLGQPRLAMREYLRAFENLSLMDWGARRRDITHRLASLTLDEGDAARAIEILSSHVGILHQDDEARRLLARALAKNGQIEEAIEHYRRLIADDPGHTIDDAIELARLLTETGRHHEARETLNRALEQAPANGRVRQEAEKVGAL